MTTLVYKAVLPAGATGGRWTLFPRRAFTIPRLGVGVNFSSSGPIGADGTLQNSAGTGPPTIAVPAIGDPSGTDAVLQLEYLTGSTYTLGLSLVFALQESSGGVVDVAALAAQGRPAVATPQQLTDLQALLSQTAQIQAAASAAATAAQAAAAQATTVAGNAATLADIRRQNAARTKGYLNQIKGYRDGTGAPLALVNSTLTFVTQAGNLPVNPVEAPKYYQLNITAPGVVQHGFALLSSVVGELSGNDRSVKIGLWVNRQAAIDNTAQFDLEVFFKNAANGNVAVLVGALMPTASLSAVGTTQTANGIRTTVTDVGDQGYSFLLFEFSLNPALVGVTALELHVRARGVTVSATPVLKFFDPVLLIDAYAQIDPYTAYAETNIESNPTAFIQSNTDAIAALSGTVAGQQAALASTIQPVATAAAQTAILSARLAQQAAATQVNKVTGVNTGVNLPDLRLNGASVAFTPTPASFPLPASQLPKGYRVTLTSTGVAQHGFVVGDDGAWVTNRPVQAGVWIDTVELAAVEAQFDLEIWWRDATNTLLSAPASALMTLAQLKVAGATYVSGGITALITTVLGRYSHVQFSMNAPATTKNIFVHFRMRAATSLGSVLFEDPVIVLDGTTPIDPYTVYSEVAVTATPPAGVLPRYSGGTPGNVVAKVSGSDAWVDATTVMQSQLDTRGILGSDGYVYPPGAAVPMPAGKYPPDAKLMLKTASAAGQPNMEPVPVPYPSDHDASTTFTVLMTGQMSHDGQTLLSSKSDPIYLQLPVGELGEYDFLTRSSATMVTDLSGAGFNLTVADTATPTYSARGLNMTASTTLTSAASLATASLTVLAAFRRANISANHALFSTAGAAGVLWQQGGHDQSVWTDVSVGNLNTDVVDPTATANHLFGIVISGATVSIYADSSSAPIATGTLTKPITSTGLLKFFTGNGNPFVGEAMYIRAIGSALNASDFATAYSRMSTKVSGRPA